MSPSLAVLYWSPFLPASMVLHPVISLPALHRSTRNLYPSIYRRLMYNHIKTEHAGLQKPMYSHWHRVFSYLVWKPRYASSVSRRHIWCQLLVWSCSISTRHVWLALRLIILQLSVKSCIWLAYYQRYTSLLSIVRNIIVISGLQPPFWNDGWWWWTLSDDIVS